MTLWMTLNVSPLKITHIFTLRVFLHISGTGGARVFKVSIQLGKYKYLQDDKPPA